jgi:formylglycine-generating enzyme required for sulfatase activity
VEQVSWNEAVSYSAKLTGKEKAAGRLPVGYEYRLPTEAEWEYACRAGTTTLFSFGDDESKLGEYGWYGSNSGNTTHPVGEKKPNGWGLYDVHGNVFEWCQDWYGNYPGGSVTDPQGPATGSSRVVRGGYWYSSIARSFRSEYRNGWWPGDRSDGVGFRPVLAPGKS